MKLIVGLGNPGDKYQYTRHNIGFMVVERLANELGAKSGVWSQDEKRKAMTVRIGEVILMKPLTFMNMSGMAVRQVMDFYKIAALDVWVIHDDLDLPLGKIRIRVGGASAGHHGIDSIIRELKNDAFVRFRLGIGHGKENEGSNADRMLHQSKVINFVLSKFRRGEAGELKHLVKHGVDAVRTALLQGLDKAMNQFN